MFRYLLLIFLSFNLVLNGLTKEDVPINPHADNKTKGRKCEVSVCSLFKNEAPFLKEWIEYHLLVGVKHFYLYNNCSSDNYLEILMPYIKKGIVELFNVPFDTSLINDAAKTHNFVQVCCYNHAIEKAKRKSTWLAIIDSDEFICPVQTSDLGACLSQYLYAGAVEVYWQVYGTSNVWELQPGELMIEKLLHKFPPNYSENWLFKSIVRPERAVCNDQHWSICKPYPQVDPSHRSFSHTPAFKELPIDTLRINHYAFRTESFYQTVKRPRRANWGFGLTPELEQERHDQANSVYDPIMLKHVRKLKKRMFK